MYYNQPPMHPANNVYRYDPQMAPQIRGPPPMYQVQGGPYQQPYYQEPAMYRRADTDPKKLEQSDEDYKQFAQYQHYQQQQQYQMQPQVMPQPHPYYYEQPQYNQDCYYYNNQQIPQYQQGYYGPAPQQEYVYRGPKWYTQLWRYITCQNCKTKDSESVYWNEFGEQPMYEMYSPGYRMQYEQQQMYMHQPPQVYVQQPPANYNYFEQLRLEYENGNQQTMKSSTRTVPEYEKKTTDEYKKLYDLKQTSSNMTTPEKQIISDNSNNNSQKSSVPAVNVGNNNSVPVFGSFHRYESHSQKSVSNQMKMKNGSFAESADQF